MAYKVKTSKSQTITVRLYPESLLELIRLAQAQNRKVASLASILLAAAIKKEAGNETH